MAKISIANFRGMIPRISDRLLQPNMASLCYNILLNRGIVSPTYGFLWKYTTASLEVVDSTQDPVEASSVQVVSGQVTAFYLLNDTWISWDVEDVDIVASYIPDSDYRIYYTGDGYPKQTDYTLATDGYQPEEYPGGYYTLGISPPTEKPQVSVVGLGNGTVRFSSRYVYTYVTGWGEESAPSPPSDIIEPEGGQHVYLSGFLACDDPNPDNIVGIRVYRVAVGEVGADYLFVPWPQPDALSPDVEYFDSYSDEVNYDVDDLVVWDDDGNLYKCLVENGPDESAGVQEPDQATYWVIQAVKASYNIPHYGTENFVIDDCETNWTAGANASCALDAVDYKVGSNSVKVTVGAGAGEDELLAYHDISSKDLSDKFRIAFWIKSSVATSYGDLRILIDDTAGCGSPKETFYVPALTAATWTFVKCEIQFPTYEDAIISVGLKQNADLGACEIWIDHISCNDDYDVGSYVVWNIDDGGDDNVYVALLANGPTMPGGYRDPSYDSYWEQVDLNDAPEDFVINNGFRDNNKTYELGEAIITEGWLPPPAGLQGLMEYVNGVYVGFYGKTLYVSEAYYPYAWPEDYAIQFPYNIVAVGHYGESLIVLTDGRPYLVTGYDPATLVSTPLPFNRPCRSKRGTVSTEKGVIYPTDDGMFMINQNGGTLLTRQLWTKEQWQSFDIDNIIAFHYEEKVFIFFSGDDEGYYFYLDENPDVMKMDMSNLYMRYGRVQDGKLYILAFYAAPSGNSGSGILEHEAATTYGAGAWWSKKFEYDSNKAFCAARVFGDWSNGGSLVLYWLVDGSYIHTETVTDSSIFRMTPKKGKVCQLAFWTDGPEVHEIVVATSVDELKEVEALGGD